MALSLGIKVGSKIQVGESIVEIKDITSPNLILLQVDSKSVILISDQSRKEILPRVFAFSGPPESGGYRLVFEAPKEIPITRIIENETKRKSI